ncbi:MAG: S41 family peptidase [Thermoplasmata archaeon]
MKKIIGFSFLIILISFLLFLSKYLVIEEILEFYLIPILLVIIVASIPYLIIRIFKKISYKKFITNSLLAACILQVVIMSLILWSATPRYFSREQVVKDINYAIKVAEDVHPNLYAIISKDSFYANTDSIKKSLPEKMSDAETDKTFRRIFSHIQDAHTGPGTVIFMKRLAFLFRKTLPYKIVIKNERLFVAKNYFYRNTIPVGSEIAEINGKPASKCLNEISKLLSYENIPSRNAKLQLPFLWALWNDFENFEITYKAPGTKTIKTIRTSGGLISNILFIKDINISERYSYRTMDGNIGYMEFNSCNNLDEFKAFLETTFKLIKSNKIKQLIIDIRRNEGGSSSLGDELMQYISKTDFKTFDSAFVKISNELEKKGAFNWIDSTKRIVGTMIYDTTETSIRKLRDNPLLYNGKSYLLVGGKTFSSATNFASSFQCYKVGKILGTETGGLTSCFGEGYTFELPNTKFDMKVATKKFVNACGISNRRGIIPDYIIENSFADDKKGIDRVLEFTIDLTKQNRN